MSFPNLRGKHSRDSLFSPRDFLDYQKSIGGLCDFAVPKGVVFCYSKGLMKHILEKHDTTKIDGFLGDFYLLNETGNQIGVSCNFGVGAPVVVTIMEELIALGVKKFVSVGEAGSLQKNLEIGAWVVCDKAIRDEGTSHHYLNHSKFAFASKELTKRIEMVLRELGQGYVVGASWTIDAVYRETVAEARKYQREGILTVEMEASALFAVAKYRKVQVGAIFTVSDSLAELRWDPKFHLSRKNWKVLFQTAVKALL